MSEKKREVLALLERIPDDKVDFVIEFIRHLDIESKHKEISPKMQVFLRLGTHFYYKEWIW